MQIHKRRTDDQRPLCGEFPYALKSLTSVPEEVTCPECLNEMVENSKKEVFENLKNYHEDKAENKLCDHQLFEVGHMKEQAREVGDYSILTYLVDVQERAAAARAAIDQALNEISNENDTEAHKD